VLAQRVFIGSQTEKMESIKQLKIFVVDDNTLTLALYEQHLSNLGYHDVTIFENGTDCLNQLTCNPTVILLDHQMSVLSGFEVLKKIKRYDPEIFVVMVSGQDNLKTAVDAMKYGAFDYIIKNLDDTNCITEVLQRVEMIIEEMNRTKPTLLKKILSIF